MEAILWASSHKFCHLGIPTALFFASWLFCSTHIWVSNQKPNFLYIWTIWVAQDILWKAITMRSLASFLKHFLLVKFILFWSDWIFQSKAKNLSSCKALSKSETTYRLFYSQHRLYYTSHLKITYSNIWVHNDCFRGYATMFAHLWILLLHYSPREIPYLVFLLALTWCSKAWFDYV